MMTSSRSRMILFFALAALALRFAPEGPAPTSAEPPKEARPARPKQLLAGVAKVEITDKKTLPVSAPLYARALVIKDDATTAVLVTVDAVAIGEIGHIGNDYLGKVRARLQKELKIAPENVIVNASHCHGVVCADVDD